MNPRKSTSPPRREAYSKCSATRGKYWNKFHNSFSIASVDITRHANSPGRTQNEHFSERNALSTQNSIKTSKKTVTWRIMTAGPLENKRGEPSLVEKKIHDELKQLRTCRPPSRRRPPANKFAIAFDPEAIAPAEWPAPTYIRRSSRPEIR